MLETMAIILIVLQLLGLVPSYALGGLSHVLWWYGRLPQYVLGGTTASYSSFPEAYRSKT
jgi:hypothetical protein